MPYQFALLAAFVLCAIVFVAWMVSTARSRKMKSRENERSPLTAAESDAMAAKAEGRVERLVQTDIKSQNALGWASDTSKGAEDKEKKTKYVLGNGKTILLADDDPVVCLALSRRLEHLGYQVFRTTDATHALLGIKKVQPDLAILDLEMPSGNGLAVCEMVTSDKQCASIPIIVHSVFEDENILRRCQQMKVHYVRKSTRSWTEIKQLVESLLEEKPAIPEETPPEAVAVAESRPSEESLTERKPDVSPAGPEASSANPTDATAETTPSEPHRVTPWEFKPLTVLCIDDDHVIIRSIAIRLQPYNIRVREADNGTQGYLSAVSEPPDLILLDLKMPNGQGDYVLSKLKDNPYTKDIPVIILTIEATAGVQRRMTSLGAEGLVRKPVHWPELFAQMGQCIQLPEQLLRDYDLPVQLTVHDL